MATSSSPFGIGPLDALHEKLLAADDMDLTAAIMWVAAMAPLLPQAYLLLSPGTRPARSAVGALGAGLVISVWLKYRFVDPALNAANCFLTAGAMFLVIRYIEWGLLVGPVVDPWMLPQHGRRHRLLAALDLTINIRGVFLGSYGLDGMAGRANGTNAVCPQCARVCSEDEDGGCAAAAEPAPTKTAAKPVIRSKNKGAAQKTKPPRTKVSTPPAGTHLPPAIGRPTERAEAIRRHFFNVVWRFIAVDALSTHIRIMGHDTIFRPGGMPGVAEAFASRAGISVLPMLRIPLEVPLFVINILGELVIPAFVCLWIALIYHAAAILALVSTIWEPAAWDVDLFDSPFCPTSLIDLWGKRWHQVLRHTFVIVATATLHILHLPHTSFTIVPLAFVVSAVFHTLAHLAMNPAPDSWRTMAFFIASGLGCTAEVLFKKITGRRVGGWGGRVWAMTFMLATGRLVTDAWLDAGFAAMFQLPAGGIGDIISAWMWTWVYAPFHRDM